MSEHVGGESTNLVVILGFLAAALVCLGACGTYFHVEAQRRMEAEEARQAQERALREIRAIYSFDSKGGWRSVKGVADPSPSDAEAEQDEEEP